MVAKMVRITGLGLQVRKRSAINVVESEKDENLDVDENENIDNKQERGKEPESRVLSLLETLTLLANKDNVQG